MRKFKIEYIDPKKLKPYKLNAKTHPQSQLDLLTHSIVNFEPDQPIVCDENFEIIKGHGRLLVFLQRNYKKCPVIIRDDLTNTEKRAARLADNRSAESPLDADILRMELNELSADMEIDELGFDSGYLADLDIDLGLDNPPEMPGDTPAETVKATELQKVWNTEVGQVWRLGEHRLICGDCTDGEVIARLMGDDKADLVLTDPPYGIKMDKGFGGSVGFGGDKQRKIKRNIYKDTWDAERPDKAFFDSLFLLCESIMIFGGNFFADFLPRATHWLVWDKLNTAPKFSDCELVYTNSKRVSVKKYTVEYNGLIGKEKERFHPTQKPVKIYEAILADYSQSGNVILDPFLGSGTTLIACQNLDRVCYGAEIDPGYCAVILQRFRDHTGMEPGVAGA